MSGSVTFTSSKLILWPGWFVKCSLWQRGLTVIENVEVFIQLSSSCKNELLISIRQQSTWSYSVVSMKLLAGLAKYFHCTFFCIVWTNAYTIMRRVLLQNPWKTLIGKTLIYILCRGYFHFSSLCNFEDFYYSSIVRWSVLKICF